MDDAPNGLDRPSLLRAAAFFSRQPEFLGYWLEIYRESEALTPVALARVLGCSLEAVEHLALCLRPRPEQLFADTAELAERYGVDQDRLSDLLHDAETLETVRAAGPGSRRAGAGRLARGLPAFAAASDREGNEKVVPDDGVGGSEGERGGG